MNTKLPRVVVVGIALAVVLDTFVQIAWKIAASRAPDGTAPIAAAVAVLSSPWFYAAMIVHVLQLWNWLAVLARADLSYAQPLTALSYISVLVISVVALHERLSSTKIAGVVLILVGVFFICRTPCDTGAGARATS